MPSLDVAAVVDTLHQIARAEGSGSQGRKLDLLAGSPGAGHAAGGAVSAAFGDWQPAAGDWHADDSRRVGAGLHRQPEGPAGTGAGVQRLLRSRPCRSHVGLRWVGRGAGLRVRPGNPVRVMLAQRLSEASEIVARLGGRCMAEYKYDGMRVQAHRTADGHIELFTRRQERVSNQFPRRRRATRGRAGSARGDP